MIRTGPTLEELGITSKPEATLTREDAFFALVDDLLVYRDEHTLRRVSLRDLTRVHSDDAGTLRVETPAGTVLSATLLGFDPDEVQPFFLRVRDATAYAKAQAKRAQERERGEGPVSPFARVPQAAQMSAPATPTAAPRPAAPAAGPADSGTLPAAESEEFPPYAPYEQPKTFAGRLGSAVRVIKRRTEPSEQTPTVQETGLPMESGLLVESAASTFTVPPAADIPQTHDSVHDRGALPERDDRPARPAHPVAAKPAAAPARTLDVGTRSAALSPAPSAPAPRGEAAPPRPAPVPTPVPTPPPATARPTPPVVPGSVSMEEALRTPPPSPVPARRAAPSASAGALASTGAEAGLPADSSASSASAAPARTRTPAPTRPPVPAGASVPAEQVVLSAAPGETVTDAGSSVQPSASSQPGLSRVARAGAAKRRAGGQDGSAEAPAPKPNPLTGLLSRLSPAPESGEAQPRPAGGERERVPSAPAGLPDLTLWPPRLRLAAAALALGAVLLALYYLLRGAVASALWLLLLGGAFSVLMLAAADALHVLGALAAQRPGNLPAPEAAGDADDASEAGGERGA